MNGMALWKDERAAVNYQRWDRFYGLWIKLGTLSILKPPAKTKKIQKSLPKSQQYLRVSGEDRKASLKCLILSVKDKIKRNRSRTYLAMSCSYPTRTRPEFENTQTNAISMLHCLLRMGIGQTAYREPTVTPF